MSDTLYAVKSGFFDAINHDRLYSADDMNQPYKEILTEGIDAGGFEVTPQSTPNMTITVAAGHAFLGGKWVDAAAKTLTVPENTTLYGRIDAVVLRVDINSDVRAANLIYRTGTPADTPEAPALIGTTGIYEVRLANIAVAASATAIAAAQITDKRGGTDCPYADIKLGQLVREQQIAEDVSSWLTEHVDPVGSAVVVDDSLSIAGAAADAKKTGDEISGLKDALDGIQADYYESTTGPKDFSIESSRNVGLVTLSGTIVDNSSYVYSQKINVFEGDVISGIGLDTNYNVMTDLSMRYICAYQNGNAVSGSGAENATTYIVPSGIDEIVVSYPATMDDVVIRRHIEEYTEYTPKIEVVDETLAQLIDTDVKNVVKSINPAITDGKYINTSGVVVNNASYYYFEIDNLKAGEVVKVRSYYNDSDSIVTPYFRFVCAYDSDGDAKTAKGAENVYGSFTVPSGIVKIAISIASNYPIADGVLVFTTSSVNDILLNENVNSALFGEYPQTKAGSLAPSETLTLYSNAVKKNKIILFKGNISAFEQITIGQGTNDLNSARYVIDSTNVTFYRGTDLSGVAHAHGLTFKDYISVAIVVNEEHIPQITIMTNGGKFSISEVSTWTGCAKNIFVTTDASTTLPDCKMSFVCEDIDKPLWIFGDSYVSYTSDRWTYHISKMGFNGYLLNGYSGEDSAHAMQNLRNLLEYGTPKYIIWDMGMNDADSASAVSTLWQSVYDELIAICNEKRITPILCTIPNVPSRNNSFKNQIVLNSGYDYIDFASAVGALDDTTWYDGMLSGDGVHPTEQGGIALASAVLKDFPYICI